MEPKMSIKGRSRIAAATASALVAVAMLPNMIVPTTAWAADETRTYTWADGQPRPDIPQTITGANGQTMTLASQGNPIQASGNRTLTQNFTQTVDKTCSAEQLGALQSLFPSTYHIDSDGYVGEIPMTSNINYWPVNRTQHDYDTQTKIIQDVDNNPVPQTMLINGRTYTLVGSPEISEVKDSMGNVLYRTAKATYQYDRTYQVLDHYAASATYSGTLSKVANTGDWSVAVVYHSDDVPAPAPANANTEAPAPGVETPAPENGNENSNANLPDPEITVSNSNNTPFENNMNNSNRSNSNNSNSNENENTASPEEKKQDLPWPLIIGAGVGALALIGVLAVVLSRRKKTAVSENVEGTQVPGTPGADMAGYAGAGVAAGAAGYAAAGAIGGAEEPVDDEPACQLIAVLPTEDGFDQNPKANLSLVVSGDPEIPSVIQFPDMVDEYGQQMFFEKEEGNSYWIAIDPDAVEAAASDVIIVATGDGQEIYRGEMATQFELDSDVLANSLNNTIPLEERRDISAELAEYDALTETVVEPTTAAAVYEASEDFEFDDDFDSEFESNKAKEVDTDDFDGNYGDEFGDFDVVEDVDVDGGFNDDFEDDFVATTPQTQEAVPAGNFANANTAVPAQPASQDILDDDFGTAVPAQPDSQATFNAFDDDFDTVVPAAPPAAQGAFNAFDDDFDTTPQVAAAPQPNFDAVGDDFNAPVTQPQAPAAPHATGADLLDGLDDLTSPAPQAAVPKPQPPATQPQPAQDTLKDDFKGLLDGID